MADRAKQHNDDLEDRAIGAAGNYGFYAKWAHEGGGSRGVEGALCYGLPKHHFGLTRLEAGRSRRSEVSKRLRGGWDEAGELSSLRPRVDGEGKRLREPRTGRPDLLEEVHRSDEYIFFGAERCRTS